MTPMILTAEQERANVIEALRAGATGYIIKPIAPGDLDRRVGVALQLVADGYRYVRPVAR